MHTGEAFNPIDLLNIFIVFFAGYLRDNLRGHDMVPHSVRRVRRNESDASSQPLPDLSIHKHDFIQLRNVLSHLESFEVDVLRSRRSAQGKCHQGEHPTDGL